VPDNYRRLGVLVDGKVDAAFGEAVVDGRSSAGGHDSIRGIVASVVAAAQNHYRRNADGNSLAVTYACHMSDYAERAAVAAALESGAHSSSIVTLGTLWVKLTFLWCIRVAHLTSNFSAGPRIGADTAACTPRFESLPLSHATEHVSTSLLYHCNDRLHRCEIIGNVCLSTRLTRLTRHVSCCYNILAFLRQICR
jgi:hypothetical protein